MRDIDHKLHEVRPRLSQVAPLTSAMCWGFGVANLLLGAGLFFFYKPTTPIAVANILSYQAWGIVFAALGIVGLYSLLRNQWKLIRALLLVGVAIKSVWGTALAVRSIDAPTTILIAILWILIAYFQIMLYINFLPTVVLKEDDELHIVE